MASLRRGNFFRFWAVLPTNIQFVSQGSTRTIYAGWFSSHWAEQNQALLLQTFMTWSVRTGVLRTPFFMRSMAIVWGYLNCLNPIDVDLKQFKMNRMLSHVKNIFNIVITLHLKNCVNSKAYKSLYCVWLYFGRLLSVNIFSTLSSSQYIWNISNSRQNLFWLPEEIYSARILALSDCVLYTWCSHNGHRGHNKDMFQSNILYIY